MAKVKICHRTISEVLIIDIHYICVPSISSFSSGNGSQLSLERNGSKWYNILVSLYLLPAHQGTEASAVLLHRSCDCTDCSRDGHMTTPGLVRSLGDKSIGYWKESVSILLRLRPLTTI